MTGSIWQQDVGSKGQEEFGSKGQEEFVGVKVRGKWGNVINIFICLKEQCKTCTNKKLFHKITLIF